MTRAKEGFVDQRHTSDAVDLAGHRFSCQFSPGFLQVHVTGCLSTSAAKWDYILPSACRRGCKPEPGLVLVPTMVLAHRQNTATPFTIPNRADCRCSNLDGNR